MRKAVDKGELVKGTDVAAMASIASAVLHSLAVRARAGDPRNALEKLARTAVDLICS